LLSHKRQGFEAPEFDERQYRSQNSNSFNTSTHHIFADPNSNTAKMVQMYKVLGRQVGSHHVRIIPLQSSVISFRICDVQLSWGNVLLVHAKLANTFSQLAMGVLATVFGGVALMGSGGQAKKTQGPPINASSSDEENYIKYVCPVDKTT
jgi:hypothetical protein